MSTPAGFAAPVFPSTGKAFVKNVVSADTIVLRGRPVNGPPPELVFSFASVSAPRLGSIKEQDKEEPFAFAAREYLRRLITGMEVAYKTEYTTTTNNRPFGTVHMRVPINGETSVVRLLIKEGWLKVRTSDAKRAPTDEQNELAELEREAQAAKKGMWSDVPLSRKVLYNFSGDARSYVNSFKHAPIPAVLEQVRDGSTFRVLLIPADGPQQHITLSLSGIKAPIYRKDIPGIEDLIEPFAEEAKYFVESRLLHRDIHVVLESVAGTGNSTMFVGSVRFPAGSIAEALLSEGLAKLVEWNLSVVTGNGTVDAYRAAEEKAKAKHVRLWKDFVKTASNQVGGKGVGSEYDAFVVRILGADLLSLEPIKTPGKERKVQLASIRGPKRAKNEQGFETGYSFDCQEFLRSRLIGQTVHVRFDYLKPAEGEFEERECVTITLGDQNIGETLLSRGLATVIRHRKDDNNRSSCYDKLLLAEERAQKAGKGVHSTKDAPVHRVVDASENANKAKQYLPSFQRAGTVNGIVEFVSSGSRFRIYIPSQSCRVTFVLGGIRAPRTSRNANEKSEPFGQEAYDFASRLAMQREVEIVFESADKVGGFIGTLFVKKTTATSDGHLTDSVNIAAALVEQGLATVHEFSASQSKYGSVLVEAETRAKNARLNLWKDYDPAVELAEKAAAAEISDTAASDKPMEAHEVIISEIGLGGQLFMQLMGEDLKKLEKLMVEFAAYHSGAGQQAVEPFTPRVGDYCCAQYTADKCWYRARVRRLEGANSYTVQYIDYGNSETLPGSRLRVLPTKFNTTHLKPQAVEAKLAYLDFPENEDADYASDAYAMLRSLTEGKRLAAQISGKAVSATGTPILNVVLYDLQAVAGGSSSNAPRVQSINEQLVAEGLVAVSKATVLQHQRAQRAQIKKPQAAAAAAWGSRSAAASSAAPTTVKKTPLDFVIEAQDTARAERINLWQYGDFTADDAL